MAIAIKRIDFRATEQDKNLLSSAAKAVGKTLSQFILEISLKEASHILADNSKIELSATQWAEMQNRLDNPRVNKAKLQSLMQSASIFADA